MKRTGFTLVEILIVVVILGILAAIVIPQFTEASNEARKSSVQSDLQTLRSAIELYKVQHNELMPPGTVSSDDFKAHLTGKTKLDGSIDAAGPCGPYLQKFPTNPNAVSNGDAVVFITDGATAPSVATDSGWSFNTVTGKVSASCTSDQLTW